MAILLSLEVVGAVVVKGAVAQGGQRLSKWRTIDIGPQLPGQVLVRRVVVTNTGSDTIRFFKVITSCGCLKGDLRPAVIAAGKTATLRVRIVTRLWPGSEEVTALLYGKAGSQPTVLKYVVRYSVHRMIRVTGLNIASNQPYYLNFGAISGGATPIPFHLAIKRGGYPGRWSSLRCSANAAELATKLKQKGKNTWFLSVVPKNLAILGSQSYMLKFSFYHKGKELRYHFSEPIDFNVRGPVAIEPDSIFFGAVPYGSTVIKNLQLVTSATGRMGKGRILSATSTDPGHAAVAVTGGGKGLRATFHAVGTQGRSTGRFLITARYGGSQYQFRVDYLAYVLGKGGKK
ncbi:MAG: DUF1573 domain-containing protein [Planctomycetia bacterium]|nr:DUF1573 domain-containing protein [Planctomycetia bacterium]